MSTVVAPLGLVEEAVDDGEGGGDVEPELDDDLALPVTPCAAGQPLYDCTMAMITCWGLPILDGGLAHLGG